MDLNSFKNLIGNEKELISKFTKELSDFLNNKNGLENDKLTGTKDILEKYKLNRNYRAEFNQEKNKILDDLASKLSDKDSLYYINSYNSMSKKYGVLEYNQDNKYRNLYISAEQLPNNVKEGLLIRKDGDNWVIDEEVSEVFSDKLTKAAENLSKVQENELDGYRREGGIYQVIDNDKICIFLLDKETGKVFQETKFSDKLYDILGTDFIIRFENGEYIYDEKLTDEFFNSLDK